MGRRQKKLRGALDTLKNPDGTGKTEVYAGFAGEPLVPINEAGKAAVAKLSGANGKVNGKAAEPPKPKTFIRHVERKLTDHDKATRGAEHRAVLNKIDDVQVASRETASDYRSQLLALRKREVEMRTAIERGVERVPVDCIQRRNEDQHTIEIVRVDKGAVIESRPMDANERQLKIPGTGPDQSEVREPEPPKKKSARRRKGPIETTAP